MEQTRAHDPALLALFCPGVLVLKRPAQMAYRLYDALGELGYFLGTEEKYDDHRDDYYFFCAYAKHINARLCY